MPFITFAPNGIIKSADFNANLANTVHLSDPQKILNKVNVVATQILSPNPGDTINLDLSLYGYFIINMPAGNVTITVSNASVGQWFGVDVIQDGVGGRSATWFSTIKWPANVTPPFSTAASKTDSFAFRNTGSNTFNGYTSGLTL